LRNCPFESQLSRRQNNFLTAKGREVEIAKGLALGADVFITKPYSNDKLVAKVKELLEKTNGEAGE
jgi:DNA-binding response OmpR family regulator